MNLKSGNDHITDGISRLLWHGIEQGTAYPQLLELVNIKFPPVPEDSGAAIGPFIDEL
jgi:hypothetical protein